MALIIGALGASLLAAQADARSFSIKTEKYAVTKLGPLNTNSTRTYAPTIRKAINAFGQPSNAFRNSSDGCVVKWRRLGLRIEFYNFGGDTRGICHPDVGRAQSFTIERSRKWRTWRGLRIGMSEDSVWRLHPGAGWFEGDEYFDEGFWLRSAESPFGDGGEYPVLAAYLRHRDSGRIKSFAGWVGSAGE